MESILLTEDMVYFDLIRENQVKFPKVQAGEVYGIEFINQTTKESIYKYGNMVLDRSASPLYYALEFDDTGLSVGQYDYFIYSWGPEPTRKGNILARGICQYGNFNPAKREYSSDITYKQYRND